MKSELEHAAQALIQGDVVIYPTETLYALGASVLHHRALERVAALKQRDATKPLPVVLAGMDQLRMLSAWDDPALQRLIRTFWPGPLSILVPALAGLSPLIQDASGSIAVRWTSHPLAQALARACGAPLAATSANLKGHEPVSHPKNLHPMLTHAVAMVLREPPFPAGGRPSTLVRIISSNHLAVLREGAVTIQQLGNAGWSIRTNN